MIDFHVQDSYARDPSSYCSAKHPSKVGTVYHDYVKNC